MKRGLGSGIAVGTTVLAAMAVSASPCPLGKELQLDDSSLTWTSLVRATPGDPLVRHHIDRPRRDTARAAFEPRRVRVALRARTPNARAIVRAIAGSETLAACGKGRGELIVRVARGVATATVIGFDPVATACIVRAIEQTRFMRIVDDSARIAIEL